MRPKTRYLPSEKITMAKDEPLEVGDVVYLKSGSPRLTIIEIIEDNGVRWVHAFGINYSTGHISNIQLDEKCFTKTSAYGGPSR